ncbi:MAG: glycyl radical enzyme [Defluviitaleaceae bacterium]|nr:glycyl radical enzyme [Defluviitaleaceae bacterium]
MKNKILSERIKKLKDEVVSIKPKICIERARLITESYKETESLPMVMRRAKALEKILLNMSIYISEGELIVGNQASKPRSAPIFPEYSWDWIAEEIDSFEEFIEETVVVS